jgi:hypothetical protein
MYGTQNVKTCDWCDEELKFNPFTRTYNKRLYLFCAAQCLNEHYKACSKLERSQTTIAFDVVV